MPANDFSNQSPASQPPQPTMAETQLINHINAHWTPVHALYELKTALQTAIEIELSTLPIYLYTYYSINRTPNNFPATDISRFADKAGGVIMSVAVEEMLHMSLAANILFSIGGKPELYLRSPSPFPSNLPGHGRLAPGHQHEKMSASLGRFSFEQLGTFLEIEYPATADAPPEEHNWQTIGQIYSYIRCIILSNLITDNNFTQGNARHQIHKDNYSPNNIDTVYPDMAFHFNNPVPPGQAGSAANSAIFLDRGDSHYGKSPLMTIRTCDDALLAIATIDEQGEGFRSEKSDEATEYDDPSKKERSHYYKFLKLQSHLKEYNPADEKLAPYPAAPAPAKRLFSKDDLKHFVYRFPVNPVAASYPDGRREVANVVSGLYQYMLIMIETIFLVNPDQQKLYFNKALHFSMIWILDKVIQAMREITLKQTNNDPWNERLAPTFENIDLGPREQAYANLKAMCNDLDRRYGNEKWYSSDLKYYIDLIPTLPDISTYWQGQNTPAAIPSPYAGTPLFPATPPATLLPGEVRHACMGLNSCKGQGRTRDNACAGQGYCSTALHYNFSDPSNPLISDHTCHVKNACAGQGGCGLYGTGEEQDVPGANSCANLGSCATPINAERFSTDGMNRGKSVWLRARAVFAEKVWPTLDIPNKPSTPPLPAGTPQNPNLFANGPTIEWIQDYSAQGMTACGASGMSGAGSCS